MNQKNKIAKFVLESKRAEITDSAIHNLLFTLWVNPRDKDIGGLRLTALGFTTLLEAGIKCHEIKITEKIVFNNALVLWMDQNIDCPFYLSYNSFWVFDERMAVQMALFSGNIQKFRRAKIRYAEKLDI